MSLKSGKKLINMLHPPALYCKIRLERYIPTVFCEDVVDTVLYFHLYFMVNAKNIIPYSSFGCLSSLTWYPHGAVQYGTRRTIRTEKIDHKYNNTNDVHRQITNYHPMVSSSRSRSSTVTDSSLIPPSSFASSAAKKSSIWVGVR